MQWYKHYLADYSQDTTDLTLAQHGAYRLLLDAYYQREGALPADPELLNRICRAHKKSEKDAVAFISCTKFRTVKGKLRNSRADKEILKYQAQCAANRRPNRQRIENESTPESGTDLRERDREKERKRAGAVDKSVVLGQGSQNLLKKFPEEPDNREAVAKNRRIAELVASGNLEAAKKLRGAA